MATVDWSAPKSKRYPKAGARRSLNSMLATVEQYYRDYFAAFPGPWYDSFS